MITIGIDIGSEFVKTVASRDKNIIAVSHDLIKKNVEQSVKKCIKDIVLESNSSLFEKKRYFLTGDIHHISRKYKKKSAALCMSSYYNQLSSDKEKLIIDAGNLNIDAYVISKKGKILDSFKNHRCSAGLGRFLETTCDILGIPIDQVDEIASKSTNPISISSGCIVFAESDVITLVNSETNISDILKGSLDLIASKICTMYGKYDNSFEGDFYLSGGLSRIKTLVEQVENYTGKNIETTSLDPWYSLAAGASFLD